MDKYTDLQGKVALITGSARGIGRACAETLGMHGASVVISDLRQEDVEKTAAELSEMGIDTLAVVIDVANDASVKAGVDAVIAKYGRVDILVNNAGIIASPPVFEATLENWDLLMPINLRGVFSCTQECIKHMAEQKSGCIISISSMAGQIGGLKTGPSYTAAKAGILGLMKSYARHGAPYGIRSNAVAPGFIQTDMTAGRGYEQGSVPLGRLGTAQDVANSVYFLASDLSSYVTGTCIDINGGVNIR